MKQLNVGDVIYNDSRWSALSKYVIDKVTDTTASSGNLKFKREFQEGSWLTTIPKQQAFSGNHYVVATKELDEKYGVIAIPESVVDQEEFGKYMVDNSLLLKRLATE